MQVVCRPTCCSPAIGPGRACHRHALSEVVRRFGVVRAEEVRAHGGTDRIFSADTLVGKIWGRARQAGREVFHGVRVDYFEKSENNCR